MKTVLDEGVPRQIIPLLRRVGRMVEPFPISWKGLKNGQLLAQLANTGFECLLTCDKNFRHQQNLEAIGIAIVVLPAQRLQELALRVPEIAAAISAARAGVAIEIPRASRSKL